MEELNPSHTNIQKTIKTMVGTIVLEDANGFPRENSNLYCLGQQGEIVWQAEKPEPAGLYNRVMLNTNGNSLSAYTVTGEACELDLMNGNLISHAKIL